jgi:hypothetical protein
MTTTQQDLIVGRLGVWCRIVLVIIGVESAELSVWAVLAPHQFFDHFPGLGRRWVQPLGPFNEHLTRDFGAAMLAVAVLAIWAAVVNRRSLVQAALVAAAVSAAPHFAYHLTTTHQFAFADNFGSLAGLGLEVVAPVALLALLAAERPRPAHMR